MFKKIAHPGGCCIFRIQVENLTRGGGDWDPHRSYVYIFSFSYSSISGDKIHKIAWQNSEFGSQNFLEAHNKVEIQF